jgi:hypothetical protein
MRLNERLALYCARIVEKLRPVRVYNACRVQNTMNSKEIMALRYGHLLGRLKMTSKSRDAYNLMRGHGKVVKKFKKAFYQYAYFYYDFANIFAKSYSDKSVKPVKLLKEALLKKEPILLCAVKNDLERVKLQVEHHRKIGVRHFAYIDNASTDGTFEWLRKQTDVSLFFTNETFSAAVKNAWKRQVMDYFGYNRWYLALDSDELFIYPGVETKDINIYIDFLEREKIRSALSLLTDMYSNDRLFGKGTAINEIRDTYCYFDTNTYEVRKRFPEYHIDGGPRMRLFSTKENVFSCALQKYTLVKMSERMFMSTHEICPYSHNFETDGVIAFLLHYKFLPGDDDIYKKHAASKLYFQDSVEYRRYVDTFEQNQEASFYYDGSQRLNNSMDLMKIDIADKRFFKKFCT